MYDTIVENMFWIYSVIGIMITISTVEKPSQLSRFNLLMRL